MLLPQGSLYGSTEIASAQLRVLSRAMSKRRKNFRNMLHVALSLREMLRNHHPSTSWCVSRRHCGAAQTEHGILEASFAQASLVCSLWLHNVVVGSRGLLLKSFPSNCSFLWHTSFIQIMILVCEGWIPSLVEPNQKMHISTHLVHCSS